ncbi:MAG: ABC transporter permease [Acidobacteriia bacterium]|nr:ABC transporter permease [Terriglobia bacterium]
MRQLRAWFLRLAGLFNKARHDHELANELESHLQMHIEDNLRSGMNPEEARRQALIRLGNIESTKENYRDRRGLPALETLLQDVRYSLRMLGKNPGFTAVAVITLALGIGGNTAIFSVIDAVILRPLPFDSPERLVAVWESSPRVGVYHSTISYPDFVDWKQQNHVFERMAAFHTADFTLTGMDEPAHLLGGVVSSDLFPLLGVKPKLGRDFLPSEDSLGTAKGRPVILSYGLWQRRFGSDSQVIGQSIVLDNQPYTIVGVMPQSFQYPIESKPIELWTTMLVDMITTDHSKPMTAQRGAHYLGAIARLKPHVSLQQARAELETIANALAQQYPDTNKYGGATAEPELDRLVGDIRPALLILFRAVGCVLLIACVNVANLLLARATVRRKEIAIRSALGASRSRIVRQLLTESVLLSLLGGVFALLLTLWGTNGLLALSPQNLPRLSGVHLSAHVFAFTAIASLLTGLLFGLLPAIRVSMSGAAEAINEGGRSATPDSRRHSRLRSMLGAAEMALALVPLVGAGLLMQSFVRLQRVKLGFDPAKVLTVNLALPEARYTTAQQATFFRQLLPRLGSLPGVQSASAVYPLPLGDDQISISFEIDGRPVARSEQPSTNYRTAAPDYFRTMHIPLLRGRDFTERDDEKAHPVIIVNETFAKRFFPNEDPLGKRIKPGMSTLPGGSVMREIIGVVGDVKHRGLSYASGPEVYEPQNQMPFNGLTLVIRGDNDPRSLIGAVREQVEAQDKDLPLFDSKLMEDYLYASIAEPRFNTLLLTIFAVVALALAAVGLYGVMSYSVAQRTHEIGIRMALGAGRRDVLKLVIGQGLLIVVFGIALGLVGAGLAARMMAGLLFGVESLHPPTFVGVALLLGVVALLACYLPARRATRVDPMVALRYE